MKTYNTDEIKNIALLGSKGAGKTTLAEAMLLECGVIKRRGTIEAKNTVSDYFPVEKEYGYSVFSTVFNCEFLGKKLNVIDCPGADDFVGNSYTALGVCDTGVIVLDAEYGVEVGTRNIFRVTEQLKKPVIFALNQIDGEKADYDNVMEQMREVFGPKVVALQYPLQSGPGFNAVIDVLLMKKLEWGPDGGKPTISDIPADQMDKAEELHGMLLEAAAENDETLMDKYFEEGSLSEDEMREGIRKGLIDRSIYPVFIVSAIKDMGVRRMMEFLGNVCPFVTDMPAPETVNGEKVEPKADGPLSIFVFKTSIEPHIGEVSYFKVMSGTLHAGDDVENVSRQGAKERLAQIYTVCGQIRQAADELKAGDIGAAVKLKDVHTGNTLNQKGCEYEFNFIQYPAPKYTRAVKPVTESDSEKLSVILTRMHEEDPTWIWEQSKELKQMIVKGQGEFHLRTLKWRIENNDKLPIEFMEPKIPYRETITKAARADYRHKKQSGGSGQYGHCKIRIMPNIDPETGVGKGYEFVNQIVGGSIPKEYIPAVDAGIQGAMKSGILAGYNVVDVRVELYDGSYHEVDSSEMAFKIAGSMAFKDAAKKAGPIILEPMMKVVVIVPEEYMGDVIGDLNSRRGQIQGMEDRNGAKQINARVPLSEMFGYVNDLRSKTQGRGQYTMEPDGYEPVPKSISESIISERAKKD